MAEEGPYVYAQPTEYKLKENVWSFSGDSFKIKNTATGEAVFQVKGKALSLRDSKQLLDANGNAIYKLTESMMSLRGRMTITDATTGAAVVTLRKKSFIPMMGTSKIQIWKGASDDGDPWIQVKGDFFRKDFNFDEVASGKTVASVRRKSLTLENLLFEKDSYAIQVQPGLNCALMVLLVVALDEQYRDDGTRTGASSRLGLD